MAAARARSSPATGIWSPAFETTAALFAGRGVLLDVGRAVGTDGELPDGFAITTEHLEATIAAQGATSRVGRGDLVVVRTGRLARARREGWGDYAGGASPGLSFTTADWLHGTEIAGIATDTWGFEVRPNEFDGAFQPLHQVAIPHIGLFIGEMWDLDALARGLRGRRRIRVLPHRRPPPRDRRRRRTGQPDRRQVEKIPDARRQHRARRRRPGPPARRRPSCSPRPASSGRPRRHQARRRRLGSGITLQGNALRVLRAARRVGRRSGRRLRLRQSPGCAPPTRRARSSSSSPTSRPAAPTCPPRGHAPPRARPHPGRPAPPRSGAKLRFGTTFTALAQDDAGVDVTFSDGSTGRYDLVVGADGIRSWTRRALGINLETRVARHGHLARLRAAPGQRHPHRPVSTAAPPTSPATARPARTRSTPTSSRTRRTAATLTPEEQLATMRELSQAYHGPWDDIRETLTDPARVNYTWFETHVLAAPWNRGRVVLIGDAAHTCPPTLAQGAAQALEDAAVLAELLLAARRARPGAVGRLPRPARSSGPTTVVDASNQLAQWLLDHVQGDVPGLMRRRHRPRPASPPERPQETT